MAHMQEEPRRSQSAVEFNPVSLYQAGQDIVQDIAQKAQEIFQALKLSQLPNGIATGQRNAQERINKLKDLLNKVEVLFKQLRVIYNECQKRVGDVEPNVNTLVPILKEIPNTEHEQALKSHKELVLQSRKKDLEMKLCMKNKQLETLVAQMTDFVWDINAALASPYGS
uniref:Mediator of RNA polymerase II transcription subunit 30 n=1 Tax=Ciona intestinalis TaxID=7719 RepID=F6ZLV3_CIOIN